MTKKTGHSNWRKLRSLKFRNPFLPLLLDARQSTKFHSVSNHLLHRTIPRPRIPSYIARLLEMRISSINRSNINVERHQSIQQPPSSLTSINLPPSLFHTRTSPQSPSIARQLRSSPTIPTPREPFDLLLLVLSPILHSTPTPSSEMQLFVQIRPLQPRG